MVPEGLNITPLHKIPQKESSPTIAFVGRLKKNKLPDHALRAFSLIKKQIPDARMWIMGDGYMRKKLDQYTWTANLSIIWNQYSSKPSSGS